MSNAFTSGETSDGASSYWAATAKEGPRFSALTEATACDVAIVGGGFTGLSAAYHLKQVGYECLLLEAQQPGWGASGRNGGMVVPRFKATYPELAAKFNPKDALTLHAAAHEALDTLERIVNELGIDCGFSRSGHLTPYVGGSNVDRFERDIVWLQEHAGDANPQILDSAKTARRLGTDYYSGAYFEPRGGGINPFAYCQNLASELAASGVRIFGGTPVLNWRSDADGLIVTTAASQVRCRSLILAMNGYSDLTDAGAGLRRRIIPAISSVIVTEPLQDIHARQILPDGVLATDAKRLTNYFRRFEDGRMLFGGRGGAGSRESAAIYVRLGQELVRIYPQLEDIKTEYRWSGRVAVTLDSLPRIGSLQPNVFYAMGYSGRGVALATYLGRMLAEAVCGGPLLPMPLASLSFPRIPFHSLRMPAKQAAILWYKLLDSMRP